MYNANVNCAAATPEITSKKYFWIDENPIGSLEKWCEIGIKSD